MKLPFPKDELQARLLQGQQSFDAVNLPAVYALETAGIIEIIHEATDVHFDRSGIIGRVMVRLTRQGMNRLLGPGP